MKTDVELLRQVNWVIIIKYNLFAYDFSLQIEEKGW